MSPVCTLLPMAGHPGINHSEGRIFPKAAQPYRAANRGTAPGQGTGQGAGRSFVSGKEPWRYAGERQPGSNRASPGSPMVPQLPLQGTAAVSSSGAAGPVRYVDNRPVGRQGTPHRRPLGGEASDSEEEDHHHHKNLPNGGAGGRSFRPAMPRLENGLGSDPWGEDEDESDFFGTFACCGGRAGRKASQSSPNQADFMDTLNIGEVISLHHDQTRELLEKTPEEMRAIMELPRTPRTPRGWREELQNRSTASGRGPGPVLR